MEDIIKQLMSDIDSIKVSLEIIANSQNNYISTVIALVGTLLGSVISLIVNYNITKKQEKNRVITLLKSEYYKDYEVIFTKFKGEFLNLIESINTMGQLLSDEGQQVRFYIDVIHTVNDVVENKKSRFIKNVFESTEKTLNSLTLLNQYIESRTEFIKYNYSDILNEIKKINTKLDEMSFYALICEQWKDKKDKTTLEEYIERYKNVSFEIINKKTDLHEMEKYIESIHKKIKEDFLGEYFK